MNPKSQILQEVHFTRVVFYKVIKNQPRRMLFL